METYKITRAEFFVHWMSYLCHGNEYKTVLITKMASFPLSCDTDFFFNVKEIKPLKTNKKEKDTLCTFNTCWNLRLPIIVRSTDNRTATLKVKTLQAFKVSLCLVVIHVCMSWHQSAILDHWNLTFNHWEVKTFQS